jgi:ribosomal protein S18 acetylase RimI-like enzyme
MSDPRLDQLADSARNRGLKLVRSRVRKPGKRGFGTVGLTDQSGKAVFGMDADGPTARPEEVENYLRNFGAKDWGASLDVAVLPRQRKPTKIEKPRTNAANDREPAPKPKREPKPAPRPAPSEPKLRSAKPADSPALAGLIRFLGHEIDAKTVRKNIAKLTKAGDSPLVATLDKTVIGLCGIHRMVTVHRPAPVGRITVLVVAESAQDKGIGRMLVEEAEKLLKEAGCQIVEVTSNDRRGAAHAFYRHMGYERTSIRFAKQLNVGQSSQH